MKIALTLAYYASFVLLGLGNAMLGPTIKPLAQNTGVDLAAISLAASAMAVGYLVGSLLSGKLYDRLPGQPVIAGSLLAMGAVLALIPALSSLPLLIGAQIVLGLAASAVDVGCNTLLVWLHGARVAPYMNALHLMFGVGGYFAPVLAAAVLANTGTVGWAYWTAALCAAPLAIVHFFLPGPRPGRAATTGAYAHAPLDHRRRLVLAVLVLFFVMIVAGEAGVFTWASSYASAYGADDVSAAAFPATFWAGFTVGRLLAIPVSARIPPMPLLIVNTLLCVAGAAAMLAGGYEFARPSMFIYGLGIGPLFATAISYAERNITLNGFATGLFLGGASLASILIPLLIGSLLEQSGPALLPGTMLPIMVISLLVVLGLRQIGGRKAFRVER